MADIANSSKFKKPTSSFPRGVFVAQLMSNMYYQAISSYSTTNSINYTYLLDGATSSVSLPLFSNLFVQSLQTTRVCFDYYLAYCGDGKIDNYVA